MTFVTERAVTVEEVNAILEEEAKTARYDKVLATTYEPIVSSDIVKSPYASTVDLSMTRVVDGDLLKVMTWYDNEWGFTNQMIRQILEIAKLDKYNYKRRITLRFFMPKAQQDHYSKIIEYSL